MMIVMLFMMVGAALVLVEVGQLLHESARARTAADAAALAGAAEGQSTAERLAIANGGVLISFHEHSSGERDPEGGAGPAVVTVVVRVGRATQTAHAEALVEWVIDQ